MRLTDGRHLTGEDLVGAVLTISDRSGQRVEVRIDGAVRDDQDSEGRRWLYRLMSHDPVRDSWQELCLPDAEGRRLGFPVSGTMTETGGFQLTSEQLTFTCTSGAIAKCIRMGYDPWTNAADGRPLLDHFRACLRMVRADYCGNGAGHTRDGTLINVYDRIGIQVPEAGPDLLFEAAWGPDGALCVRKTRITEVLSLKQLRAACPARWPGRLGRLCTPAAARAIPEALLFNESR